MAKRKYTEETWRTDPWFRALNRALVHCKTEQEMADLLRDVGTLSELQAWAERLEVAKQLAHGYSYRQVAANTGASTTTVTRVAKFIENGEGGYRTYLKKQKGEGIGHDKSATDSVPRGLQKASTLQKYLNK